VLPDPSASERPLSAAAGVFAGIAGAKIMGAAALVSIFGYLAGVTLNVSRLTFAMAEQGDMPAAFRPDPPEVSYSARLAVLVRHPGLAAGCERNLSAEPDIVGDLPSGHLRHDMRCAGPVEAARGRSRTAFTLPAGCVVAVAGILFSLTIVTRLSWRDGAALGVTLLLGGLNWLWARTRSG
jgi:hypothetical protein